MRKYELMMIVSPNLSDDDRTTLLAFVQEELAAHGTSITNTDDWGVRDLAYNINNSHTGYYLLYTVESDGREFTKITESFNIKKDIWRFMFSKIED